MLAIFFLLEFFRQSTTPLDVGHSCTLHFPLSFSTSLANMKRRLVAMAIAAAVAFFTLFVSSNADQFSGVSNTRHRVSNSPTASLCAQLIQPAGYLCTEHTAQTKDGFLLGLQRVSSRSTYIRGPSGPPVLLLHGLAMSGDAWFLDSPKQSLGFILADNGFDVWAGNVRGTRWSHGHVSLSEKDKKFWDWSWQELALYDFPGMANYVSSVTNSTIFVVGHSQGTIMSFAAFTQPDIVSVVEAAALLSPIAYLGHTTSKFALELVKMHIDEILLTMGIYDLNLKSELTTSIMDMVCKHVDCIDWLTSITGENCCLNRSQIDFYLNYEPHPTSVKNMHHLFQMIRHNTFKMYDYGIWMNMNLYGKMNPPSFDLTKIPKSLPLWMAYGGNDALADFADFWHTLQELPCKSQVLYLEDYGHLDFLLSVRAKEDLYDDMIKFFRSHRKFSSY